MLVKRGVFPRDVTAEYLPFRETTFYHYLGHNFPTYRAAFRWQYQVLDERKPMDLKLMCIFGFPKVFKKMSWNYRNWLFQLSKIVVARGREVR